MDCRRLRSVRRTGSVCLLEAGSAGRVVDSCPQNTHKRLYPSLSPSQCRREVLGQTLQRGLVSAASEPSLSPSWQEGFCYHFSLTLTFQRQGLQGEWTPTQDAFFPPTPPHPTPALIFCSSFLAGRSAKANLSRLVPIHKRVHQCTLMRRLPCAGSVLSSLCTLPPAVTATLAGGV